jgi:FkbM family methyltransferase
MFWFRKKIYRWLRLEINRVLKVDFVQLYGSESLRSHLREILRDYRIDTVIDVGANEGQFGVEIRAIGFRGEIHSFEPVKRVYRKLQETTAGDPRWFTHNFALGEAPGKAMIHVFAQSVFSSLLPASAWGENRYVGMKADGEEEIEIGTFDAFRMQNGLAGRRIMLKMDTQGYDLKVFKGAAESLGQVCCILSELSFIPIYDGMPDYAEALSVYENAGFSVSGFYPVTRNKDLSVVETDCVMVRRDLFESQRAAAPAS